MRWRVPRLVAVVWSLALGGCDPVPVAPSVGEPPGVALRLALGEDLPPAFLDVAGKVDRVRVRLVRDVGASRDVVVPVAGGTVFHLRLSLTPEERVAPVTLQVELSMGEVPLFAGEAALRTSGGSGPDSVRVSPVWDRFDVREDRIDIEALGGRLSLPQAVAFWATGDRYEPATVLWESRDPDVLEVLGGAAAPKANGETWLVATFDGMRDSAAIRIEQIPRSVQGIAPTDVMARIGDVIRFRLLGTDANGHPLLPGARTAWSSDAPSVASVHPREGVTIARCQGSAGVSASDSPTDARVSVVPASPDPSGEVLWTRTAAGVVAGDLSGAWRSAGVGSGRMPTRAPGTDRIAFVRAGELHVARIGSPSTPLATGLTVSWPEFSADGAWIFFEGSAQAGEARVYRIRPDGTGLEAVSPEGVAAHSPTTSPDGRSIAFVSGSDLVIQEIGGEPQIIHGNAVGPKWSPDGRWIAVLGRTTHPGLWFVRPDGGEARASSGPVPRAGMAWSPDSRLVVGLRPEAIVVDAGSGHAATLCWISDAVGMAWWR